MALGVPARRGRYRDGLPRRRLIESPRWLAASGRITEADAVVRALERQAGLPSPDPREAVAAVPPDRPGLSVLFRAPYRARTIMLWTHCLPSVTAYYGFGTLAPQSLVVKKFDVVQGLGFTALSFMGYPIGSLVSVPLLDRVERRTLIAGSALLMAASGIGFGLAGGVTMVVAFGFCYTLLSNVFSTASHVYLAEQYPTAFRATAAGAAYSLSRLSAALLPFVLLPVLTRWGAGWLFATLAASVVVMVATILLLGDRTNGTSVDRSADVVAA